MRFDYITIVSEISPNISLICIKLVTNTMKTFLSLTLLVILLLKVGGFYAILSYERHEIREKVEQKLLNSLEKSALICIVENAENFPKIIWERSAKEFEFEDNLYDIAYVETISGINYYYCLSDKDETRLEVKIDKLLENQSKKLPFGNQSKLVLHFLSEPIITYNKPTFNFNYFVNKTFSVFPNLVIFCTSDFVSKLKQPPQLF
jgi:hypothetical protein